MSDRPGPPWTSCLLVGLAAALVHGRAISFGYTYLDDRDFIVDDQKFLAQSGSVLHAFGRSYMNVVDGEHPYYRPLVTLSYALDAQWSGFGAFGYHLTNVVLHAIASVLFLALVHRIDFGRIVTFLAALVFAVHPIIGSAVAWIPGRNESLLAIFALASWLFFLREVTFRRLQYRLLHIGFFWLALLTKESAIVLPLVCLTHLALLERDAPAPLMRWPSRLVLAGGWIVGVAGRLLIHPPSGVATVRNFVHNLPLFVTSLGELALPVNPSLLTVREDLPLWPGLLMAGLIAVATRFVPGVRSRVVALGIAVFALFLSPVLGVPGVLVLNTRLYLPACGAIIALAEIVRALPFERATVVSFAGVITTAFALIALAYEGSFRDRRAFSKSAVDAAPHSALAHFCLGQTYQIDGDADGALAEYRMALSLGATYVVHNNMAVIYMASARWLDAEHELLEEIAVDPRYARAFRNLGVVLRREGRIEDATAAENRARELTAGDPRQ
ncbi:MAG: glycosyltransferase family 39 protein [Myxococcota bacterium]|nr:glycosyltransferase family 39 protein [Myxococcota bacterium]